MMNSVGTAPVDNQVLPPTESSTNIDDAVLSKIWSPSIELGEDARFPIHGEGDSIKSVAAADLYEVVKGDYVVCILGTVNSPNFPRSAPETEADAIGSTGQWLNAASNWLVPSAKSDRYGPSLPVSQMSAVAYGDIVHCSLLASQAMSWPVGPLIAASHNPGATHAGRMKQRLLNLWHEPEEVEVRIENVTRYPTEGMVSGTSPSPAWQHGVGRVKSALANAVSLLANVSSSPKADSIGYLRQTDDFFRSVNMHTPMDIPGTDLKEHVLSRKHVRSELERALRDGSEEVFEYGMESMLSRSLHFLIRTYSNDAMVELARVLAHVDMSSDVKEECLLQLGAIDHNPTSQSRLSLLIDHLWSEQIGVRDCAALGIAAMDDPLAIYPLQRAKRLETSDRLRDDLQLVLDQLTATRNAQLPESHS